VRGVVLRKERYEKFCTIQTNLIECLKRDWGDARPRTILHQEKYMDRRVFLNTMSKTIGALAAMLASPLIREAFSEEAGKGLPGLRSLY